MTGPLSGSNRPGEDDSWESLAEDLFASDSSVHRYETSFVKREVKFAPFVDLGNAGDSA